jgi:hypothetical protein
MLLPLLNFSKNFPEIDGWIPFFLFVCVLFFFTFYIYSRNKSESRIEQGSAAAAGAIGSAEHFWEQQTVTVSLNNIPFPLSQTLSSSMPFSGLPPDRNFGARDSCEKRFTRRSSIITPCRAVYNQHSICCCCCCWTEWLPSRTSDNQ